MGSKEFKVGQSVAVAATDGGEAPQCEGTFHVVRIMPNPANGEPSYRIKGGSDGHEHAVSENQIVTAAD